MMSLFDYYHFGHVGMLCRNCNYLRKCIVNRTLAMCNYYTGVSEWTYSVDRLDFSKKKNTETKSNRIMCTYCTSSIYKFTTTHFQSWRNWHLSKLVKRTFENYSVPLTTHTFTHFVYRNLLWMYTKLNIKLPVE